MVDSKQLNINSGTVLLMTDMPEQHQLIYWSQIIVHILQCKEIIVTLSKLAVWEADQFESLLVHQLSRVIYVKIVH
jgi:hypothetical protein